MRSTSEDRLAKQANGASIDCSNERRRKASRSSSSFTKRSRTILRAFGGLFCWPFPRAHTTRRPVDSLHAKTSMLGLHPNITMQRSPSHAQTRTLLWSHVRSQYSRYQVIRFTRAQHEKMCVIDETIAFMGGFDLCFGRWCAFELVICLRQVSDSVQGHAATHAR